MQSNYFLYYICEGLKEIKENTPSCAEYQFLVYILSIHPYPLFYWLLGMVWVSTQYYHTQILNFLGYFGYEYWLDTHIISNKKVGTDV